MKPYVNIRIRIRLLALKMKWSVQCQWLHKTPIYPAAAEQYGVTHTPKSTQVLQSYVSAQSHAHARHARHSRVYFHSRVRWVISMGDSLASVAINYARAHTLMCFVGLFPLIKFPQTHSRTRQCNLQVLVSGTLVSRTRQMQLASSNFRSWARYIS